MTPGFQAAISRLERPEVEFISENPQDSEISRDSSLLPGSFPGRGFFSSVTPLKPSAPPGAFPMDK